MDFFFISLILLLISPHFEFSNQRMFGPLISHLFSPFICTTNYFSPIKKEGQKRRNRFWVVSSITLSWKINKESKATRSVSTWEYG